MNFGDFLLECIEMNKENETVINFEKLLDRGKNSFRGSLIVSVFEY